MRKWQKNLFYLSPIWLYALYILAGIGFLSAGWVKEWTVVPGYAILNSDHDKDGSMMGVDGPHVFYNADSIVLKSVVRMDTGLQALVQTYPLKEKSNIDIHCEAGDRSFTTRLKPELQNEPTIYPEPDSLIAISDIEGEFHAFCKILLANAVMSRDFHWTFGTGHLVLVGDFFDRGLHVTECLWLIYHLECEAEQAGGKVHFILGNHEIMNMQGDLRYVRNKYLDNTQLIRENYRKWFTPLTELGRWLQTKNVAEKIGPLLFVHGGFSKKVLELRLSLDEITSLCRPLYFTPEDQISEMDERSRLLMSSGNSLFWYRGYIRGLTSKAVVKSALEQYAVSHIIVGHTVVPHISTYYDGRVIGIDTKHAEGVSEGLHYSAGMLSAIDTSGGRNMLRPN